MDRVLAGRRLQLTYLHDQHLIDDLRLGRPVDRSLGLRLPAGAFGWAVSNRPGSFNHLLLATNRQTGLCEAVIAGSDHVIRDHGAVGEAFLLIDTTLFSEATDLTVLPRRMLAVLMARAFARARVPAAIAVRTRSLSLCDAMQTAARRINRAVLYPEPKSKVVPLGTADLAYRIARALGERPVFDTGVAFPSRCRPPSTVAEDDAGMRVNVVLDLRNVDRDAVVQCAQRLYRARMPKIAPRASTQDHPALSQAV